LASDANTIARARGEKPASLSVLEVTRNRVSIVHTAEFRCPTRSGEPEGHVISPSPRTFADLGVADDLVAALAERGITEPFETQIVTIPDALAGRDVCGRAPTGSGKTLAFGVPVVSSAQRARSKRPTSLILVPTRELAAQVQRDLEPLARARRRRILAVYGGVGYGGQRSALRQGVDVLVACPGRLLDLLAQSALRLDAVEMVVIDEADRMADFGFLPDVRRLLDQTAPNRQTLLFSATLDREVARLTRAYQNDPVFHTVGTTEPDLSSVSHRFWNVEPHDRIDRTAVIVRRHGPTIVFCRTRHGVDRVAKGLVRSGLSAAAIHGGRSQSQRDRALAAFASGDVHTLVATDVAARGIHVTGVACVVHYDLPDDTKAYVHRSGRTARAGASGMVVSFVGHQHLKTARDLVRPLGLTADITSGDAMSNKDSVRSDRVAKSRRRRRRPSPTSR
jgi:superfamily II DNA/RNA helicase